MIPLESSAIFLSGRILVSIQIYQNPKGSDLPASITKHIAYETENDNLTKFYLMLFAYVHLYFVW